MVIRGMSVSLIILCILITLALIFVPLMVSKKAEKKQNEENEWDKIKRYGKKLNEENRKKY